MLDYPLTIGGILPETPEQVLNLQTEIVFNDGVGPGHLEYDVQILNDSESIVLHQKKGWLVEPVFFDFEIAETA
jgi:hypothetical protein